MKINGIRRWAGTILALGVTGGAAGIGGTAPSDIPEATDIAAAFMGRPGFRVELVAADPDLMAPVALAFDERGRLFVAERPVNQPQQGRVSVLEDPDSSGVFRVRVVYAEGVSFPSALACYDGGVFVGAGSEVLYFKDTQGDGRADVKRVVFSGFSPAATNSPGTAPVIHTLAWGPDGRIHGGTLMGGGRVSTAASTMGAPLGKNDFSFDPRTLALSTEAGPSLSGFAFDLWGRKFVTGVAQPLGVAVFWPRYWERNPYFPPPPATKDIAGAVRQVYRHPAGETNVAWVSGPPKPPVEGEATNQLAAAWIRAPRGLLIYNGPAFPAAFQGNAFMTDPENHVVFRVLLRERGGVIVAERAADEAGAEFLVARTPEFRPVALAQGPEGELYVADYADGVRGRVFRVVPNSLKRGKRVDWAKASALDLVAGCTSTNAWHRFTATRLLVTRPQPAAVPFLSNVVFQAGSPLARATGLRMMANLEALTEPALLRGLSDSDARVREQAVALAEDARFAERPSALLLKRLNALAADASANVRYQLALSAGAYPRNNRNALLEVLLRRDLGDAWVEAAVLSSLEAPAAATFGRLGSDPAFRNLETGQSFLARQAAMLGVRGDLEEAVQTLNALTGLKAPPLPAATWLYQFGAGLQRTRSALALVDPQATNRAAYPALTVTALEERVATPVRAAAIRAVGVSPFMFTDVGDWLLMLLNPKEVPAIHHAVLEALQYYPDPVVGAGIVARWSLIAPGARAQAGILLTRRAEWSLTLLSAIQAGRIHAGELSPATVHFLRAHPDAVISQRAVQVLGTTVVERPQVLAAFKTALELDGVAARGRETFTARCGACHDPRLPSAVGGPLLGAPGVGKERLLADILEPHRTIAAWRQTVVLETRAGEMLVGVLQDESATAVSLRLPNGREEIYPQGNISQVIRQSWSLMPEGLELGLTPQDVADLLAYLASTPSARR